MTNFARVLIAFVVSVYSVGAFMPSPAAVSKSNSRALASSHSSSAATAPTRRPSALQMGWGDALGKAFANEDMAPQKNPGLKSEPNSCMVGVEKLLTSADGDRCEYVRVMSPWAAHARRAAEDVGRGSQSRVNT